MANTAFTEGIQFLWAAYRSEYWFWELIETYRRLSCTSILATFYVQTPLQCVFGTLLSIFYVKLYTSCKVRTGGAVGRGLCRGAVEVLDGLFYWKSLRNSPPPFNSKLNFYLTPVLNSSSSPSSFLRSPTSTLLTT